MDLGLIIALNMLAISAMIVGGSFVYRQRGDDNWLTRDALWLGVNAAVVVVGLGSLWLVPDWTALLISLLFVPFVAAPVLLFRLSQRFARSDRNAAAAWCAYGAAILHPTAGNWLGARLQAAVAKNNGGDPRALDDLARSCPPQYRALVEAQIALAKRDWPEILALSQQTGPADAYLKPFELRALGETGQIDAMVRCYLAAEHRLAGGANDFPRLIVMAFGGRPDAVARILQTRFPRLAAEKRDFWSAVADCNSRESTGAGAQTLQRLATSAADAQTRVAAAARFAVSVRPSVSPSADAGLDWIAQRIMAGPQSQATERNFCPLTTLLVLFNAAMFAAEIAKGGSENEQVLTDLGGLIPEYVFDGGQWWRLVTCMFLHFGFAHIATNMFVLWVLGRSLEVAIGWPRMLAVYFLGGIASSAAVLWLMWMGFADYGLLVGASGAIFALFGARVAIAVMQWRSSRGQVDTQQLKMLMFILVLQGAIDLSIPNVSFSAHVSGLVAGFVIMMALSSRGAGRARSMSDDAVARNDW